LEPMLLENSALDPDRHRREHISGRLGRADADLVVSACGADPSEKQRGRGQGSQTARRRAREAIDHGSLPLCRRERQRIACHGAQGAARGGLTRAYADRQKIASRRSWKADELRLAERRVLTVRRPLGALLDSRRGQAVVSRRDDEKIGENGEQDADHPPPDRLAQEPKDEIIGGAQSQGCDALGDGHTEELVPHQEKDRARQQHEAMARRAARRLPPQPHEPGKNEEKIDAAISRVLRGKEAAEEERTADQHKVSVANRHISQRAADVSEPRDDVGVAYGDQYKNEFGYRREVLGAGRKKVGETHRESAGAETRGEVRSFLDVVQRPQERGALGPDEKRSCRKERNGKRQEKARALAQAEKQQDPGIKFNQGRKGEERVAQAAPRRTAQQPTRRDE